MKTIRIKFVDFYEHFVPENFLFYKTLAEHYKIELSDTPDYLFFSVFGNEHLKFDCVKIFWTGENQTPDFNVCDYAVGFDYLNFDDRYLRFPLYYTYKEDYDLMLGKTYFQEDTLFSKTGFCSFVYSNNYASPERKEFFDLLSAYKLIASGGRYLNNTDGAVVDKLAFQKGYKFAIAFENASYPGYATEKLVQAFAAQSIPIYWGDPKIAEQFNTGSFINCHDFASFTDVIKRVKQIDNDDAAYLQMLQTPALVNAENEYENAMSALSAFLENIVEQPLRNAKRYNREYWGRKYIKKELQLQKAYNRSLRGLAEKMYMKYFKKIEKNNKSVVLWRFHKILMRLFNKN